MKSYLVLFCNKGKKICTCWKRAHNKEEAREAAEWALMCHYPNVIYSDVSVIAESD